MVTLLGLLIGLGIGAPAYDGPVDGEVITDGGGFFSVRSIEGRWWFVDPNGRAFFMRGTDHIRYEGHGCEALGYAPYGRYVEHTYSSEQAWCEVTVARLKAWGFNALGSAATPSLRYRGLPHVEFLGVGMSFASRDALCPQSGWTGFPNVFSPGWPAHCDQFSKERCASHADDPWLIGYFLDNELEWFGKQWLPHGLFHETWKLPATHTGKQAWVAYVRRELQEPARMADDWGVRIDSFDQLADHTEPMRPLTDSARTLALGWVSEVAEQYFKHACEAIRRHDPNHLVLGCRFAGPSPGAWSAAGRHCNVVSFNYYPDADPVRGIPAHVLDKFRAWQAEAHAPMMITEWSFPALDTELPSTHGAGVRVDDQRQRAACFDHFQRAVLSLPYMVGSNFFMYLDEPELGIHAGFPENSNYGLVNNRDVPYEQLTATASVVHAQADELHRRASDPRPPAEGPLAGWLRAEPVLTEPAEPTLTITSGKLRLESIAEGGAWRVAMLDRPLGVFRPMLQQITPGVQYVFGRSVRISGWQRVPQGVIVDMIVEGGPPTETESAEHVGLAEGPPRRYRSGWRFWIATPPALEDADSPLPGWFAARCDWIENIDTRPWTLAAVYHFMEPNLGGSPADDEPLDFQATRYHRRGGAWFDRNTRLGLACWLPAEMDFYYQYWKEGDTFHADVHYDPYVTLAPGQRYEQIGPRSFHFAFGDFTRAGFAAASREIERQVYP